MDAKNQNRYDRKRKEKYAPQGSMSRNVHLVTVLQKGKKNLSRAEKSFFNTTNKTQRGTCKWV